MAEQNISKLVLVLDDEEKSMKLITSVLALEGYRFLKAIDGEEAIAHLKEHDPDIIIADINMPKLNKWKLGFWIVENKKHKKIPIIFLSALRSEEGLPNPGEYGDYHMPKPFEAYRLIRKIEELLSAQKTV